MISLYKTGLATKLEALELSENPQFTSGYTQLRLMPTRSVNLPT